MALMDDEFPDIVGTLIERINIVQDMLSWYMEARANGLTQITDFTEGSEARNILEAVSIPIYQILFLLHLFARISFVKYAFGEYLDLHGEFWGVLREGNDKSRGDLRFYHDEPVSYDITIPEDTLLQINDEVGLEFRTIETKVLFAGETEILVKGESLLGGLQDNVAPNTITIIQEGLDELEVTNPQPFIGATDEEEDDHYRARIQARQKEIERVGTVDWYKSKAESIEGVHDATVVNQPVGRYTVGLIINGNHKPTSNGLVNQVRDWFYQQDNLIGGMDVIVKKTNEKPVNFQITGTVAKGQNPAVVKETINNDLKCLIEGGTTSTGMKYLGLDNGDTLYMTQIYAVLQALRNILPSWYITVPSWDIAPRFDEVLVLGEVNLLL